MTAVSPQLPEPIEGELPSADARCTTTPDVDMWTLAFSHREETPLSVVPWPDLVGAFLTECDLLSRVLRGLDDGELGRPSNCPPWDLRELLVHTTLSSCRFAARLDAAANDGAAVVSAADYYRRPERATEPYRQNSVDVTQRAARPYPAHADVLALFESTRATTAERLNAVDPDRLVAGPTAVVVANVRHERTAMTTADFFATRVVGLVAHAMDVALTLGRDTWTSDAARKAVLPVVTDLLGADPSAAFGIDGQRFIEVATGRRQLTRRERDSLGSRAELFPLLS